MDETTADGCHHQGEATEIHQRRRGFSREMDSVLTNFSDSFNCTRQRPDNKLLLWTNNTASPPTLDQICERYAPIHLKTQFQQIYQMLHPGLVVSSQQTNASLFLEGAHGSGKRLCLEQCLQAFRDELQCRDNDNQKPHFRIVRVHGILVPGSSVHWVVQDILRQLSSAALEESHQTLMEDDDNDDDPTRKRPTKKARLHAAKELFRLRQTSFTNHIQLLNEILEFASVDNIPILFVLDELDAFVGTTSGWGADRFQTATQDRQLLLYHLLDRVATGHSYISLVGLTSHHGIMNLLEKRIKSRAEGTKFVHFGPQPCHTVDELKALILDKMPCRSDPTTTTTTHALHTKVSELLSRPPNEGADPVHQQVYQTLQRSLRLGNDVRWFCRVFHMAFAAYRHDCLVSSASEPPAFRGEHVRDALVSQGASFLTEAGQHDLMLINGVSPDVRLQALRDLAGPEIALVFCARRILTRDNQKEEQEAAALTMDRMLDEYKSYRGSTNRYTTPVLWKALDALLDCGLLRPAMDHSGQAPLQYGHDGIFHTTPPAVLARIPLHLNVDIHRELKAAIQKNFFDCSTALREWGKKTN